MVHYIERPSSEGELNEEVLPDFPAATSAGRESPQKISGNDRLRMQYQEALACIRETLLQLTQEVGEQQETLLLDKEPVGDVLHSILRLSLADEAMQMVVNLLASDDPAIAEHTLDALQQLRRRAGKWERNSQGWFELRYVNGNGPYLYHRYRGEGGKKYTQYYGRLEKLQGRVEIDPPDTTDQD